MRLKYVNKQSLALLYHSNYDNSLYTTQIHAQNAIDVTKIMI